MHRDPAMQEPKLTDPDFPRAQLEAPGYQVHFSGQKSYNGVAPGMGILPPRRKVIRHLG